MAKPKLSVRETIGKAATFLYKNPIAALPIFLMYMLIVVWTLYYAVYSSMTYWFGLMVLNFLVGTYALTLTVQFIYDRLSKKVSLRKTMEKVTAKKLVRLVGFFIALFVSIVLLYMIAFIVYFITPVAAGLLIVAGYVFMLYATVRLMFTCNFIIIEGKSVMDSARASWKLTDRNVIKLVLIVLSVAALSMIVAIAYGIIYALLGMPIMSEGVAEFSYPMQIAYYVLMSAMSAFYATVGVVAFVKLRRRRRRR